MAQYMVINYMIAPEKCLICLASGDGGIRFEGTLRVRRACSSELEGCPVLEHSGWRLKVGKVHFGGSARLKASCSSPRVDSSSSIWPVRARAPSVMWLTRPCSCGSTFFDMWSTFC